MTAPPAGSSLPDVDAHVVVRAAALLVAGRLRAGHHASHGATTDRATVLVEVELEDGSIGWGECPALPRPTYTSEYAAGAYRLLADHLLPVLVEGGAPAVVGHPMATGAVADARLDAVLRSEGRSLQSALGGGPVEVPVRAVVTVPEGGERLDALVAAVGARVEEGHRHVALKVARGWLREPLAAVRSTWPDLGIAVDANGSLGTLPDDRWTALGELGLDGVEQPCAAGDWLGSARVAGCLPCPVILDEAIGGPDDVRTAAVLGAGRVVNLKPARVGGVARAVEVAAAARAAGMDVFVGGMLESGVGRASALALAGSPWPTGLTHLGPSRHYWDADVTEPLEPGTPGTVAVPTGPGIGRRPDADALAARTLDRVECHPGEAPGEGDAEPARG